MCAVLIILIYCNLFLTSGGPSERTVPALVPLAAGVEGSFFKRGLTKRTGCIIVLDA